MEAESRNYRMSDHEFLLKEKFPKLKAYRSAITPDKFSDKVVLDLSFSDFYTIFAIQARASKCYTLIKPSKRQTVERLLKDNKCLINENVFLIEDISEVKGPVHIIIHDWSDTQVLSISNLIQLIRARDRCLVNGGLFVPPQIRLEIAAVSDPTLISDEQHRWDFSKYDIDFGNIPKVSLGTNVSWGSMHNLEVSPRVTLWHIVPYNITIAEVHQCRRFLLEVPEACTIHGLAVYLEVKFTPLTGYRSCHQLDPCVYVLSKAVQVKQREVLSGKFSMSTEQKKVTTDIKTTITLRNETSEILVREIRKFDLME